MSESTNINSAAKSYNDFTALGELRGKAQRNEAGAMRESAEQFEALFIQMMLKSMREASSAMKSDLLHNNAQETFEGMYDKEISMQMAKRNALGFSDVVIKNLSQQKAVPSTSELLAPNLDHPKRHALECACVAHVIGQQSASWHGFAKKHLEAFTTGAGHAHEIGE
jgi:flagellar protein FlgJ